MFFEKWFGSVYFGVLISHCECFVGYPSGDNRTLGPRVKHGISTVQRENLVVDTAKKTWNQDRLLLWACQSHLGGLLAMRYHHSYVLYGTGMTSCASVSR